MIPALDVLVSGCSIAGPAVAFWLSRAGHRVTVLERAEQLRVAGQNVDVRGTAREVLRRMELEATALSRATGEKGIRFVGDRGDLLAEFPAGQGDSAGASAELEILRGTLSSILVDACPPEVDYRFGDHIVEVLERDEQVEVVLRSGDRRRYDLLVIAEGAQSRTRTMVFNDVPTRRLGLYVAYGAIERNPDLDDQWWTWFNAVGGRSITLRPDDQSTTRVALSFLSGPRNYENLTRDEQRAALRAEYAGVGWQAPRILDGLSTGGELYVDDLTQVRAPSWVSGRTVLLGDAAWCATPISGIGTSLALTGAYTLAGEVSSAPTIQDGLRAFKARMRPSVRRAQRLPPGTPRLAHPRSRAGLAAFRTALRVAGSRPVRAVAARLPSSPSAPDVLPRYQALGH